jgi:hypothetical protein
MKPLPFWICQEQPTRLYLSEYGQIAHRGTMIAGYKLISFLDKRLSPKRITLSHLHTEAICYECLSTAAELLQSRRETLRIPTLEIEDNNDIFFQFLDRLLWIHCIPMCSLGK